MAAKSVFVILCLALSVITISVHAQESCSSHLSCLECTKSNDRLFLGESLCVWQLDFPTFINSSTKHVYMDSKCVDEEHAHSLDESVSSVLFEDRCPVYHDQGDSNKIDLSNWMSALLPVIGERAVLDLALPGTHDTLSYDLSLQVSDGGIDDHDNLSKLLHRFSSILPDSLADYMRQQAMTQSLSIVDQLNNGARFLDIRMMYEKSADDWFSLHLLQSNEPILSYLKKVHQWMVEHPSEIVVMWLSKHGNTCATSEDQYPGVSIATKQAMFDSILEIFADVTMDTDSHTLNTTSINTLVDANNRAIFLMSDFEEMTVKGENRNKALDACQVLENVLSPSFVDASYSDWMKDFYASSIAKKEELKKQNKLLLLSLASGVPSEQMIDAAAVRFLQAGDITEAKRMSQRCADAFHIEGMKWCPESLSDISNLLNYFSQEGMSNAFKQQTQRSMFPNAIYINGLDVDGGVRTGTSSYWGMNRSSKEDHALTTYSYVPSMIASTVMQFCIGNDVNEECTTLMDKLKVMIDDHPATKWSDPEVGRVE